MSLSSSFLNTVVCIGDEFSPLYFDKNVDRSSPKLVSGGVMFLENYSGPLSQDSFRSNLRW